MKLTLFSSQYFPYIPPTKLNKLLGFTFTTLYGLFITIPIFAIKTLRQSIWTTFLFILITTPPHFAITPEPILLHTAISSATRHSKKLQIQKNKIKIKQAEHQIAISELLPSLDASFDLNSIEYEVDGRDALAKINVLGDEVTVYPVAPSKYSSHFNLMFSQTLFSGGRILAQIGIKKFEAALLSYDYQHSLRQQQREISTLYWRTLISSLETSSADTLAQLTKTKLAFLNSKSDKGFLSKKNLRESEIDFYNRNENKLLTKQIFTQSNRHLIEQTKLPYSSIQLSSSPRKYEEIAPFFQDLKTLSKTYEPLSVKQSKLNISIAEKNHAISKSLFMPDITLSSGVSYFDADSELKNAHNDLKLGDTYIRLTARYNLFSGFKDMATFKKSKLETQLAQLSLSTQKEESQISTDQLIQNCQQAITNLKQLKKNADSMNKLLNEAKIQFNHNQLSQSDIIDTQIHHADALLLYQKATIEVEIALSELAFQIGEGDKYLRRFSSQ